MTSYESTSPPPPVSSLRSRFEKMAAASSPPPQRAISPLVPRIPNRTRASSITDLKEQHALLDPNRVVSGTSEASKVPGLRSSPSTPDLKSSGKSRPAPPPPRGSRTPSPQPPVSILSSPNFPASPGSNEAKPASLSRRPPPPPPPPLHPPTKPASPRVDIPTQIANAEGNGAPPAGAVASLKSKFNNISPPSGSLGNGRPTTFSSAHSNSHHNMRAVSTTIPPPALPARPGNGGHSPIKKPRSSLPVNLMNDLAQSTPISRMHCLSPSNDTPTENLPIISPRGPPPPVPSRSNVDLLAKAANIVQHQEMQWSDDPVRPQSYPRSSSESTSSGSGSGSNSGSSRGENAASALRRVPPPLPSVSLLPAPPPLPKRRSPSNEAAEESSLAPPALPSRPSHTTLAAQSPPAPSPKPSLRLLDGITPPPTRSIGINDKLPPARQTSSGGYDDSDEEGVTEASRLNRTLEDLPDSTHCSRRLPILADRKYEDARVYVPATASVFAAAGPYVVVAGLHHDFKVCDISSGSSNAHFTDLKDLGIDWRVKEPRITAMEFRAGEGEECGRFLWCGSKDGNVWEFDIVHMSVVRVRPSAHSHAVVHIMRHGRSMITMDETGKALVWKDFQDLGSGGQPRIARTADKQGFVKMFGGLLWTSNGSGNGTSNGAGSSHRSPVVRVYDIMSSNCTAKMITPPDQLGAVTSGAILPSRPDHVYLGHEGGYVTCWSLDPQEGSSGIPDMFDSGRPVPACVQVIKISASDVLSLEGVLNRLWVGSRGGTISAYDVETKPWTITNAWQAHGDLPVLRILVDPFSIEKCQQLHVITLGRDEYLHFWDGLLGTDWIEGEVQKREAEFSTYRNLNILICSWNTDAQKPDQLFGSADNVNFLENVLHSVDSPDIIAFGFQELIDLENHSITAKNVLLGSQKKKSDGLISEKVSRSYRMWHERLVQAVRIAMPVEDPYVVAHTDCLVGLFCCIFVRQKQRHLLRDSAMTVVKRGMGGRYGNKGALIARFVIDDSSLCFINCHLTAGHSQTSSRNQDLTAILEHPRALPRSEVSGALAYVGGGDGSMILDHDICFLNGDLNYRIDQRRDVVINAIQARDFESILKHDQLRKQAKNNPGFRLRSFIEAPITFAPTYKYDPRTDTYDTSEKKRTPAWCDRVLFRCRDPSRVQTLHYRRYEVNVADHRPISAAFRVTVKSINRDSRVRVKSDVEASWKDYEPDLLFGLRDFYATQYIL